MVGWIIATLVMGLAAFLWHQYRRTLGIYVPHADRQPARPANEETPLGMEATDLGHIARTTRANETLERANTNWTRPRGGTFAVRAAETDVAPWGDDASYAARFHAAFLKDRSKDQTK